MFHLVARARPGTLLFRTHVEARALWDIVVRTFPELIALCLMPNHLHLVLPHADPGGRLADAMRAFARWRNAGRGVTGPVWDEAPGAKELPDASHVRRTVRYVALNPCRGGLVSDPLAWPWSTHRDAVGFALDPVVPVHATPDRHQRFVSADDTVNAAGTPLPATRHEPTSWPEVVDAVCGFARAEAHQVQQRGPARNLALRTAWAHGLRDVGALAIGAHCDRSSVFRAVAGQPDRARLLADPALDACVRAVGDPRFCALDPRDLRLTPRWGRYSRLV